MDDILIIDKIQSIKNKLGDQLIILTHHYQRKEIVELGDFSGDSFALSQRAASCEAATNIIFCGVHFMAESAEILSRPYQIVQIPDVEAGCWMADMADTVIVKRAWDEITSVVGHDNVMPVVYMNSDAELKAFCGRNGGIVCTSSNAPEAFNWGLTLKEKIFFFPDQHLGRNSGNKMGIPGDEMIVWNPSESLGGNTPNSLKKAKLILWDGYCLVHTRFKAQHINEMRDRYPEAKIIVHPECTEDVVNMADAVGSTGLIVKYVKDAPSGSRIIIGTEINLIERLAYEFPDKKVMPLYNSLCPNMFKINIEKLLYSVENLGRVNVVKVPDDIKVEARKALDRMLDLPLKH